MSKRSTIVSKFRSDGTLVRVHPDGLEEPVTVPPLAPMSDEAVHAAAVGDPDAQPLGEARLAGMTLVPRVRSLRRALGLTQDEFSARYHIPLGTLRDWEQGRCEPDQPAKAYLKAIAGNPEGVLQGLRARPRA
jgi:putative transcriptional regulator